MYIILFNATGDSGYFFLSFLSLLRTWLLNLCSASVSLLLRVLLVLSLFLLLMLLLLVIGDAKQTVVT